MPPMKANGLNIGFQIAAAGVTASAKQRAVIVRLMFTLWAFTVENISDSEHESPRIVYDDLFVTHSSIQRKASIPCCVRFKTGRSLPETHSICIKITLKGCRFSALSFRQITSGGGSIIAVSSSSQKHISYRDGEQHSHQNVISLKRDDG